MRKTIILFLLITNIAFAQKNENASFEELVSYSTTNLPGYDTNIKGSPYLDSEYENVKIYQRNLKAKYNAFKGYFEVIKNNEIYYLAPSQNLEVIYTSLNKTYKVFEYKKAKEINLDFFKVVSKIDNNYLLVKEEKRLLEAVTPLTGYDTYEPARFKMKRKQFYIKFNGAALAEKLPKKRKEFFKKFGNKSTEVMVFVNKEKLDIRKEKDLVKIINFYTSL